MPTVTQIVGGSIVRVPGAGQGGQRGEKPKKKPPIRKPVILPSNDLLRFYLVRGSKRELIDDWVESASWDDSDSNLRGSITLRQVSRGKRIDFTLGDRIRCDVRLGSANWTAFWDMVLDDENRDLTGNSRSFTLTDEILNLDRSQDTWKFVKGKGRKKGWLTGDVIREVGKRYGFRVVCSKTEGRVTKYVKQKTSPMQVIQDMLSRERQSHNRRMMVQFRRGVLYVTPLQRSKVLLEIGDLVMDGRLALGRDSEKFATQLTLRATAPGKGKRKPRKIHLVVENKKAMARFGRIHKEVFVAHADSIKDLEREGKQLLSEAIMPKREFSFSHQGIPGLKRGQSIQLDLVSYGLTQVVWVKSVSHQVSSGTYTVDVTLVYDDPFKDEKAEAAKRKRAAAARKRKRKAEEEKKERDRQAGSQRSES